MAKRDFNLKIFNIPSPIWDDLTTIQDLLESWQPFGRSQNEQETEQDEAKVFQRVGNDGLCKLFTSLESMQKLFVIAKKYSYLT